MKYYNDLEESAMYLGDNRDILPQLPAHSFSLMVTDPPYKYVGASERKSSKDNKNSLNQRKLFDYDDGGIYCRIKSEFAGNKITEFLNQIPRVMKKMNAFIFCNDEQISDYYLWAKSRGFNFRVLVWEKPIGIICKSRFAQNVEFIVRIYERGTGLNNMKDSNMYNKVLRAPIVQKKVHPTQKPVEIIKRLIELTTDEGDAVLDPFMGSGTTPVAAASLGRKYVGIEKEEEFYSEAEKRMSKLKS